MPDSQARQLTDRRLDLLIDAATVEGQLQAGVPPTVVASRSILGARAVTALAPKNAEKATATRNPAWTAAEDRFLKVSIGILSEEDIGEALGRTATAVHLRWSRDLRLPAPSKDPSIMTANQAANGMGIDAKSAAKLIEKGMLPGYRLATNDVTRVVQRSTLLRFLVNPLNWVYFNPDKVGLKCSPKRGPAAYDDEFWIRARRLVLKKKKTWDDKWLRIGEVARMYGVHSNAVSNAVRRGRIPALDWGNYWILRSVATDPSVRFLKKGVGLIQLSDRGKAFMITAHAVGLQHSQVAALMKWPAKRIEWFFGNMRKKGEISRIIKALKLPLVLEPKTGHPCADWREHASMFPVHAKNMDKLSRNEKFTKQEAIYFNSTNRKADTYKRLSTSYKKRRTKRMAKNPSVRK